MNNGFQFLLAVLSSVCLAAPACWARFPNPGVPVEGTDDPAPAISKDAGIARATLLGMYRVELGELFKPQDADKLLQANQLIEGYFETSTAAGRKTTVKALEQTGLEPGVIGRLIRVRMHWPKLAPGTYYVNEKQGPFDVRYFLGVPQGYDRARGWPMVVKLAPIEPFITNPPPDATQVTALYNGWIKDELTLHPDALLLMPLVNLAELYGPSYGGMNSVIQPMLHAADRVNIDPARVYLIGHSTGGMAAWNLALNYPTYFAAIAPLAGGLGHDWQKLRLVNLRNVLPVVWHDADDKLLKIAPARAIIKSLKNQKIDVDYVETKGLGHTPSNSIVAQRYEMMRSRVRQLYPPQVTIQSNRPEVLFNRNDWVQIWQEDDPGKETRELFRMGTGHMDLYQRSAKADAKRDGNTITLALDNVESMRLYLNDQMVDLKKPLTIIVNKKRTIHGGAKQSIEEMMLDQLFLGRGWRYYTAVLDIDLTDPGATTKPTTNPASRPAVPPKLRTGRIIVGPGAADGD
ncbi:MAG TPA: hypothetical protein VFC78_10825 [Tepidisphaeraceae bacterium]|nr:hypothetical protein [Tepidisphaeraceae bacterium]